MARPPKDAFQIGWICALQIEAAAAAEMLDEHFGILEEQDEADSNSYTLGRIGKHHVVIACLPHGQYGSIVAAAVASNMVRTFSKSLRFGVMVGIGSGIPSAQSDIRLGDIVISYPQGNCGGVIQYDSEKYIAGVGFQPTGHLGSPPRSLLDAIARMRAAELRYNPRYPDYLHGAVERSAQTRKAFGRPNKKTDRLFKPEHVHQETADGCDGCPAEWEETRCQREDSDPQPHYGIIASGNTIIRSGRTREQLRLETGAICLDIEAAGLMLNFPCIIIRGVCDYADSHKNYQWQGFAALAAASYTKDLLRYVTDVHVSQGKMVVDMSIQSSIEGTLLTC